MSDIKSARRSSIDIRRRTETLHRAAGQMGDNFLQYLFGMALLYLDSQLQRNLVHPVEASAADASRIAKAAKLLNSKASGG